MLDGRFHPLPSLGALAAGCLLLAFVACTDSPRYASVPLGLGDVVEPDFLTEAQELQRPPDPGGNRFLTGWKRWQRDGELLLVSASEGARLELVNLVPRERHLLLDLELEQESPRSLVRAYHSGRELVRTPLRDPLVIPLPADLPLGRVTVSLEVEGDANLAVRGARLSAALPSGSAGWDAGSVEQSGDSIVDLYVRAAERSWLVGELLPPENPTAAQRFSLWVEDESHVRVAELSWSPGWRDRFRRRWSFRFSLGETSGYRRLRLVARGQGPPARWRNLALQTQSAAPAPSAFDPRPSPPRIVVLYVLDALRADVVTHLGGRAGVSPTIDRLAREGVTFQKHHSVAPNTLPSTKALFLGHTFRSRGGWALPADGPPTLAERFREAGYRTGLFSGNGYLSPAFGLDRGFDYIAEQVRFRDEEEPPGPVGFNDNAARVHAAALDWLRGLKPGERAFLYLHTIHPHNPYDPPAPLRSRFTAGIASTIDGSTRTLLGIKHGRYPLTEADRRRLQALYLASFAYNDSELGRLLGELSSLLSPEDLFLAVTSDHGEELFDHGGVLHGYTLYQELIHIPLVLWAPGRISPGRVSKMTDALDLHATLLDLIGSEPQAAGGRSSLLGATLQTQERSPRFAAASSIEGGIFSARSQRWKVVWAPRTGWLWGMGEGLGRGQDPEYLFDLVADPREQLNVAGDGDLEAAWLRSRLLAWAAGRHASTEGGRAAEIDEETRARLRALGYADSD